MNDADTPLHVLAAADPELFRQARERLTKAGCDLYSKAAEMMADDVVLALSGDPSLGNTVADGYLELIQNGVPLEKIGVYSRTLRQGMEENSTYARILASSLVPVLIYGDEELREQFFRAADMMKGKWLYAMAGEPLEILSHLIKPGRLAAGAAWLALLADIFAHDLTYNQFRRFSSRFPRAVLAFPESERAWRIELLRRVARRDFNLACVFIDALSGDLSLLPEEGLRAFVDQGLTLYEQDAERGRRFLGLENRSAIDVCARLQTSVRFVQVRCRLGYYLQARCGYSISIKPLSALPSDFAVEAPDAVAACCDGRALYLPDEINRHSCRAENSHLYKALAWLETGLLEFDTFHFDLEKVPFAKPTERPADSEEDRISDLELFCRGFSRPDLAADLLTVFEYGRIRVLLVSAYPGGAARFYPVIRGEAERIFISGGQTGLLEALYAVVALGASQNWWFPLLGDRAAAASAVVKIFEEETAGAKAPEASAAGVRRVLEDFAANDDIFGSPYRPLTAPFGLRLVPELYSRAFSPELEQAARLKEQISRAGAAAYKSDITKKLADQGGQLYADDVEEVIRAAEGNRGRGGQPDPGKLLAAVDTAGLSFKDVSGPAPDDFFGNVYRYKEWDDTIGDYLSDHVLVRENGVEAGDTGFYRRTLDRHRGLAKKIRYAFEFLKPEGVAFLRKWREGEDFDYRQLLEYAIDKKTGRTPSERIYMKRVKQQRDVAVLLLLDLSRSTSNYVSGSATTTVLDIEKEAVVLFCEALSVVGDPYAIAGFSGSGRLGVDYYRLKDFGEAMTDTVAGRVEAVRPRRNTRMGAAVRHAITALDGVEASSRLLIVVSDGFPNDLDYKRSYALADTRRALLEARAKNISVHNITVNIAGDVALDSLYGRVSHSVISDVRELPAKLLRIYGRLTA